MLDTCVFRLQGLMGCLQPQQGEHFSLCTRRHFLILQNELGPSSPTWPFLFIFTHLFSKLWAYSCIFFDFTLRSSRAANRGIVLADSDELYGNNASLSNDVQSSSVTPTSTASTSEASASAIRRLKEKFNGLWLSLVRRWPTVYLTTSYFYL